jgi:hypothetical protein
MFFNNPLKLVSSNDFFKNKKTGPFENIVGFTIYEEFMIVAEVCTLFKFNLIRLLSLRKFMYMFIIFNKKLLPNGQSLRLQVSLNAEDFAEARFPPNMLMTQNVIFLLIYMQYIYIFLSLISKLFHIIL